MHGEARGGGEGSSEAGVKAFVQWDVTCGELFGPRLSDARMNDHKTPFDIEELPEGSLYIADLGFFAIERFYRIAKGKIGKRYFVSRLQSKTNLYNRRGHCIELAGILPKQVDQVREIGAVLGQKNGVPVRVIMLRVPEEVAEERQERIPDIAPGCLGTGSMHAIGQQRRTHLCTREEPTQRPERYAHD